MVDMHQNHYRLLAYSLLLLAVFLTYAGILFFGIPRDIGWDARHGLFTPLVFTLLGLLIRYLPKRFQGLAILALTLNTFALPLAGLWATAESGEAMIGGLLPFSDAGGYYTDALRLLNGERFSSFSTRRPFFASWLATLLGLTGQNLQLTLGIMTAILAVACFFVAREIKRTHGLAGAMLTLVILFLFQRRFIGTLLTENLGLALGAVAFAILWRAAVQRTPQFFLAGLFILTIALNARAGAFFVLPALGVWAAIHFRQSGRINLHVAIRAVAVIVAGFLLNIILVRGVGSPAGAPFSNFSWTLYGLVFGGNWTQVFTDHPELQHLAENEAAQRITALTFARIVAHPTSLVQGMLQAWSEFFFSLNGAYSFILTGFERQFSWRAIYHTKGIGALLLAMMDNPLLIVYHVAFLCFSASAVFGLYHCIKAYRRGTHSMMLALFVGIFASVPFAPPWDADRMRVYAATIPFFSVASVLGLTFLTRSASRWQETSPSPYTINKIPLRVGCVMVSLWMLGALVIRGVVGRPVLKEDGCERSLEGKYVRITPGMVVRLLPDDFLGRIQLPDIRVSDFRSGLTSFRFMYGDTASYLSSFEPPALLFVAPDLRNGQNYFWYFNNTLAKPSGNMTLHVCGESEDKPGMSIFRI